MTDTKRCTPKRVLVTITPEDAMARRYERLLAARYPGTTWRAQWHDHDPRKHDQRNTSKGRNGTP